MIYRIDIAETKDLDDITSLNRKAFIDSAFGREDFEKALERDYDFLYAAFSGSLLAGYMWLRVLDDAELLLIAVSEEFRRRGIGTMLLERAVADTKELGVRSILLEVRKNHTGTVIFYEKNGFEVISERKGYYGGAEDALIMRYIC